MYLYYFLDLVVNNAFAILIIFIFNQQEVNYLLICIFKILH
jgi:hypothetical protein